MPAVATARIAAAAALAAAAAVACPASAGPAATPPAVVVAIVGDTGLNPLHREFAATGTTSRRPPNMPPARAVPLPGAGTFTERLGAAQRGPLGALELGRLYTIAGTKLDVVVPGGTAASGPYDLLADRYHGTGVTAALAGNSTGTNPDVRVVFVAGNGKAAWDWVADQPWIDIVLTSNISVVDGSAPENATCGPGGAVQRMAAAGRPVFASAGNAEQLGAVSAPNALPSVYRVGGADRDGRPWQGVHPDEDDPNLALGQVTRPYDTADLYAFQTAAADSDTELMTFGGTSGATPRTAGRAARLIATARAALRQNGPPAPGSLANGPRRPAAGPLADGALTRPELFSVLRASAKPSLPDVPGRYAYEGYGAHDDATEAQATRLLTGAASPPARTNDDSAHAAAVAARSAAFPAGRC